MTGPLRLNDPTELRRLVGSELPLSHWRAVDQDFIDRFAALTGDDQWIHVDPERARRELPDGRTIVPGHLLLALMPALLRDIYVVAASRSSRFAALREVRFRQPVLVGQRFRLQASISHVAPRRGLVFVGTDCTLRLEDGEAVMVAHRVDAFER